MAEVTIEKPPGVRSRYDPGVDWGRERIVLIRQGKKELWWMKPGKVYAGRAVPLRNVLTELRLIDYEGKPGGTHHGMPVEEKTLFKGGRLSRAHLLEHGEEISDWFGGVPSELLEVYLRPGQTLVLVPAGCTQILVVLQNAWYKDPKRVAAALQRHGYDLYVRTLRRSHSGGRLVVLFGDNWDPTRIRFINSTETLVDHPSKKADLEPDYVAGKLRELNPDTLVLMGKQAHKLYKLMPLPQNVLLLPHPAHRMCSREFWFVARELLQRIRHHPGIARSQLWPTRKGPVLTALSEPGKR